MGPYLFIRSDGINNDPETFCLRYPRSLLVCEASDLTWNLAFVAFIELCKAFASVPESVGDAAKCLYSY